MRACVGGSTATVLRRLAGASCVPEMREIGVAWVGLDLVGNVHAPFRVIEHANPRVGDYQGLRL